jgi:hypothetical protein
MIRLDGSDLLNPSQVCGTNHKCELAANASDNFFKDISDEYWKYKINIHCNESQVDLQEGKIMSSPAHNNYDKPNRKWNNFFFVTHEPTFTCGYERKIGSRGDGGKWICDPHRIVKGSCLVYSIGSNNQFDFEEGMHSRFQCETHTFDPTVEGKNALPHVTTFHKLGISSTNRSDDKLYYSIGGITRLLNHANRTIDIFKIDCERCEWDLFNQDFFLSLKSRNMKIRQILIELHTVHLSRFASENDQKTVHNFFRLLSDNGYVISHKEPNVFSNTNGNTIEYSFLLLEGLKCPSKV